MRVGIQVVFWDFGGDSIASARAPIVNYGLGTATAKMAVLIDAYTIPIVLSCTFGAHVHLQSSRMTRQVRHLVVITVNEMLLNRIVTRPMPVLFCGNGFF